MQDHGAAVAPAAFAGFLLRHGLSYTGKARWTKGHFAWLETVKFDNPFQQIVLQEYIDMVGQQTARVASLEDQMREAREGWSLRAMVEGFMALRGVNFLTAMTVAAELGDITRFDSPRQLSAVVGLTPSEHSSGSKRRLGRAETAVRALPQAESARQAQAGGLHGSRTRACPLSLGGRPGGQGPSPQLACAETEGLSANKGRTVTNVMWHARISMRVAGQENPRGHYEALASGRPTLATRQRQLRDEVKSGGNQPTNNRLINRRFKSAAC